MCHAHVIVIGTVTSFKISLVPDWPLESEAWESKYDCQDAFVNELDSLRLAIDGEFQKDFCCRISVA